jgi:hypothetical protein
VRNLTLVESWNGNPEQLAVGDSMTRSLTLQADGVPAAQLPALPEPEIDGGRLYADQPQLENSSDARGLRGKRVQSAALIASRPGPLQLPGARVVWWDVDSDSEKVAEIAPRQLQIRPAAAAASSPPAVSPAPATPSGDAVAPRTNPAQLLGWQLATALLACAWLATLWWSWHRQRVPPAAPAQPNTTRRAREYEAFKQLQASCRANEAAAARSALLNWGAARLQRDRVDLQTLKEWAGDEALQSAIDALERHLYAGTGAASWRGDRLLAAVSAIRGRRQNVSGGDERGALPPLYPGG